MANPPPPTSSNRRQKRMGPAPFASFEDLSDEVRSGTETSPSDMQATRLPGIHEDATPVTPARETSITSTTLTPSAPRIDISRASSSSHHEDSRDSTPERELFQGGNGQCKLGLAFKEEGALELRSSTEELDFQDPSDPQNQQHRTSVTVVSASTGCDLPTHQRKDSQGSEFGGLLSISGRTSRLSSIGSQGSRVSGQSRLSVTSEMSRSPSPHKMLLETSFCGSKTGPGHSTGATSQPGSNKIVESELLERVLLSRKHDPTEAILAEGISIECRRKLKPADSLVQLSPVLQHVNMQQQQQQEREEAKSPEVERSPIPPEKPARKSLTPRVSVAAKSTAPTITPVTTDVIITVDKPSEEVVFENDSRCTSHLKPGEKVVAESGIEYTFIPLKGPLPKTPLGTTTSSRSPAGTKTRAAPRGGKRSEPQYIRIKLKPDHMYPPDDRDRAEESCVKPVTLDLGENGTDFIGRDMLNGSAAANSYRRSPQPNSTPSPSVSRKSSFASLFRAKDYGTSPESPTIPAAKCRKASSRSRSKSSDRDHRSDSADKSASKHKSVFTLFKSKKAHSKSKQSLHADTSPSRQPATTSLHSLEFTFDPLPSVSKKRYEIPLDADTIIIPLHSPGNEPPPLPLYADTPEEQKLPPSRPSKSRSEERRPTSTTTTTTTTATTTVVDEFVSNAEQLEIHQKHVEAVPEIATITATVEAGTKKNNRQSSTSNRQSSTSSENVVFSTNLGSDNEIFTTKLPKKPEHEQTKERGRARDRATRTLELAVSQAVIPAVTSVTSSATAATCVTKSASRTSLASPVQIRSGLTSPCTSVNAKISEIITEKGMTSARVSKTTSPVARKAEKLIIPSGRQRQGQGQGQGQHSGDDSERTDLDKDVELSAAEPDADTSERATAGGDSSESETDFPAASKPELKKAKKAEAEGSENEVERKGLVLQTDSFDDELPYVPTTLPLERSVAVPIVPVKQRAAFEIKTCPIERPRSTTPINPSCLEEYVEDTAERATMSEKLRICLPREDSLPCTPGTVDTKGDSTRGKEREKGAKKWTEFVPKHHPHAQQQHQQEEIAPPLPPRGFPKDWINFEDIPERRKPPKRIQTIPSRGNLLPPTSSTANVVAVDESNVIYSYVNPEDCKCECHEATGKSGTPTTPKTPGGTKLPPCGARQLEHEEDEQPLLLERRSDSSPDSQTGAGRRYQATSSGSSRGAEGAPPPTKNKSKPTNAFPKVATTKPS